MRKRKKPKNQENHKVFKEGVQAWATLHMRFFLCSDVNWL